MKICVKLGDSFSNNSIFSFGGHFVQLRKNVTELNYGRGH